MPWSRPYKLKKGYLCIYFKLPVHTLHAAQGGPKTRGCYRTTLLSSANLPSHGPPGQNFYASNQLFSIPWLGGWMCHMGVVGLDKDRQWKAKGTCVSMRACVCTCVWSNHLPLSCPNIKEYTLLKPNTLRKYQLIELTLQENAMLALYGHTHWQKHKKL